MNTHTLRLSGLVYLLIAVAIAAVAAGALLLSSGDRALGTGDDSPTQCTNADDTGVNTPFDAPSGEIVTGVCIKGGNNTFGTLKHSGLLTVDGTYGTNDCFVVSGIGTPMVTVTAVCRSVSHLDINTGPAPTPTPTATPTATGTPPAEATPTATPTAEVLGEVLGEIQGPTSLPTSGGAPEEATVSSLYLLLGLAGLDVHPFHHARPGAHGLLDSRQDSERAGKSDQPFSDLRLRPHPALRSTLQMVRASGGHASSVARGRCRREPRDVPTWRMVSAAYSNSR